MPNISPSFHTLSGQSAGADRGDAGYAQDLSKLIAFYLPQYHRVKENSEWWGPGFTEWTNVARGRPNFEGHYQPHIPRELGFYDLDRVETMREQSELARANGIYGFCFYYYWFSGRRILERPLDNFLASDIDMPFCLCWANENWTRTWDGDTKSVLLGQEYAPGDEERFIQDIFPFLNDSRYIRVGGQPLLVVYRIKELPHASESIDRWRAEAKRLGLPGLHVSIVDFYDVSDPREVGADALVEFPPHKFNGPENQPSAIPKMTNLNFSGSVIDYSRVIAQSVLRPEPPFALYRGIIPGWDNTARRQDTGTILVNAAPALFGSWLKYLRAYTRSTRSTNPESLIFVNAWNEWGEGCHLEPDVRWGTGYLDEVVRSTYFVEQNLATPKQAGKATFRELQQIAARDNLQIAANLHKYKPTSTLMRRIGNALRRFPVLRKLARKVYRAVHALLN